MVVIINKQPQIDYEKDTSLKKILPLQPNKGSQYSSLQSHILWQRSPHAGYWQGFSHSLPFFPSEQSKLER